VTAKGGSREKSTYDGRIAIPYIVLLLLNLIGMCIGVWNLVVGTVEGYTIQSVILNLVWTFYNVIILAVCAAVAWEQREVRRTVRVTAELPAKLMLPDNTQLDVNTIDLSEGGTMVKLPRNVSLPLGTKVKVALCPDMEVVWTEGEITRSAGEILAMKFMPMNLRQERQLIFAIFGRADAWMHWAERRPADKVGTAFGKVLRLGMAGAVKPILGEKSKGQRARA
jgi:cellulose synthase (UDP-forming)